MFELLKDAYDLHIHSAPDVVARRVTDTDLAKNAALCGMKGFVIKAHQFNTAGRAALIREQFPGCNALGSVTLNAAMGGINPLAVEMAGRLGAKVVWFPTVDAENEHAFRAGNAGAAKPYGAVSDDDSLRRRHISVFENGAIADDVYSVLDIIAAHGMVLATGHISKRESLALVKAAKERKVEKIILTHPNYPATRISAEEQKEYIKAGAFIEQPYLQIYCGEADWNAVVAQIRAVGPEHVVLSTDMGQVSSPEPHAGLDEYIGRLLREGFDENSIRTMIVKNTAQLVD